MYNRFKPLPNIFADFAGRNIQATEVGALPFQQRIALLIHAKLSKPNTRRRGPEKRRGPRLSHADFHVLCNQFERPLQPNYLRYGDV
jgi:hypothetical protein